MLLRSNILLTCLKRFEHSWIIPDGFNTGINIHNCVARQKVPLILKEKNIATWYTCGPTVYDDAHIGHASCYVKLDIIQKILRNYFNIDIITVMNITDVDDKIISRCKNSDYSEFTKRFETDFWNDLTNLRCTLPNITLRVTENMNVIVKFIEELLHRKFAYKTEDGSVYFDLSTTENYGKLQNIGKTEGGSVGNKRNVKDFALWKSAKAGEPFWETPWGSRGRPGWHIECSALASHVFGKTFDVHAGGIDLRFPHHENEEIQSCSFHNCSQWVNYWVHTGHLQWKNVKMSKSLKNTIAIKDLLKETSVEVFRLACAMNHYSSNMEFSHDFAETASNKLKNYKNFLNTVRDYKNGFVVLHNDDNNTMKGLYEQLKQEVHSALIDDFNTPQVLKCLDQTISSVNSILPSGNLKYLIAISNCLEKVLDLFDVREQRTVETNSDDVVMEILNEFRSKIRTIGLNDHNSNLLKLCDQVRDNLRNVGITVKDHSNKISSWSR